MLRLRHSARLPNLKAVVMLKRFARIVLLVAGLLLVLSDVVNMLMPEAIAAASTVYEEDEPGAPIGEDESLPAALVDRDRDDDDLVFEVEDEGALSLATRERRFSLLEDAPTNSALHCGVRPALGFFDIRLRPPRG